jgi:DNA-binding NarL/FixJ family response regulator
MNAIHAVLIDDSQEFLEFFKTFLAQEHPRVQIIGVATDVEEGIDLAKRYRPDVVLLAVNSRPLIGFAATRNLKNYPRPPRVILASSYIGELYQKAALAAGADGFIAKIDLYKAVGPLLDKLFGTALSDGSLPTIASGI